MATTRASCSQCIKSIHDTVLTFPCSKLIWSTFKQTHRVTERRLGLILQYQTGPHFPSLEIRPHDQRRSTKPVLNMVSINFMTQMPKYQISDDRRWYITVYLLMNIWLLKVNRIMLLFFSSQGIVCICFDQLTCEAILIMLMMLISRCLHL